MNTKVNNLIEAISLVHFNLMSVNLKIWFLCSHRFHPKLKTELYNPPIKTIATKRIFLYKSLALPGHMSSVNMLSSILETILLVVFILSGVSTDDSLPVHTQKGFYICCCSSGFCVMVVISVYGNHISVTLGIIYHKYLLILSISQNVCRRQHY